ncbi:tetratricopeptide repeat protein [Streptomyces sp. NBC_00047]|uniref:AfsR/SARP family transcriptional regulator n=1 Tax=Streptomyces sp. NBC_00047 TaxID=2975627 RepID=UPI00224C942A|nr:BTAD domain-containing putative transcriptional regulator [Streptomyces sp. NBC_00047]MCX5612423.1 tetratricopeptide repeat protein [Streptomyces sp. NBC_00047]
MFHYRVLGPLDVRRAGESIAITAPKERDLLALLLLNADRPVPAEELIDGIWGGEPPSTARTTLQNYVKRLRHALHGCRADGEVLATQPGGYVLRLDHGVLDLREFELLTRGAAEASERGDDATASARLRAALALWQGEALAGSRADRLTQVEAPRLNESRMVAFENRVQADLRLGRHADVIIDVQSAIVGHPLRERLHGQLMLALYRSGRRGDALTAYQQARAQLVHDLGLEPGPELAALHRRVLAGDPELLEPRAPRTEPGASRAAGRSAGAASGQLSGQAPPAQLPGSTPAFAGRADVLRRLDAMLPAAGTVPSGVVRIGLITGQGGAGKTALAVHWGHRRRDAFPDGQLYVNLRGHDAGRPLRSIDALGGFLQAFGVPAQHIPVEEDRAAALYRSLCAGKRMLVVLDNARCADQVRPLFPGSSECLVLVTSRDSLAGLVAREGAAPLPLRTLEPGEAEEVLLNIIGAARVHAEPEAAAVLTAACAYLPLAVAITAADLAVHPDRSLADQAARLAGDRLGALQVPGDEGTAVRAVLDMSFATLSPAAARMFRLFGMVPGCDVPLRAAAALAGAELPAAARLLEELVRSHLLEEHAPGRFTFHDLLRAYAVERVREQEGEEGQAAALDRLHSWYLGSTDNAVRLLQPETVRLPVEAAGEALGFDGAGEALEWMDAERPNAVALVQRAAEHGPRQLAWTLADALRPYMMRRAYAVDWLAVGTAGLAAAEADGNLAGQAAAHRSLSSAYLNQSDYDRSMVHDHRALELYRATGSTQGQSSAHNSLCIATWYVGDLNCALLHGEQCLELSRSTGFLVGEAITMGNVGAILHETGRLAEAEELLIQALARYEELGLQTAMAIAERNLGAVLFESGQAQRARGALERAAAMQRRLGNETDLAYTFFWLALTMIQSGDRAGALDHIDQGFEIATGEARAESYLYVGRALLSQSLGNHGTALHHFGTARDLARRCNARTPELRALLGLAESSLRLGRYAEAAGFAEAAREPASRSGYGLFHAKALILLAELDLNGGDFEASARRAGQAVDLQPEAGHRAGRADALVVLGHARRGAGDEKGALRSWTDALDLYEALGAGPVGELRALMAR